MVCYFRPWTQDQCKKVVRLEAFLPILQILPAHGILITRMYAMVSEVTCVTAKSII